MSLSKAHRQPMAYRCRRMPLNLSVPASASSWGVESGREETLDSLHSENEMDAMHHVKAWQLIIIGGQLQELKYHHVHVLSYLKATVVSKLHDGTNEHVHINFISSFGAYLILLYSLPLLRQPRRAGQQVLDTSHTPQS